MPSKAKRPGGMGVVPAHALRSVPALKGVVRIGVPRRLSRNRATSVELVEKNMLSHWYLNHLLFIFPSWL